jgi:hypothetical protein
MVDQVFDFQIPESKESPGLLKNKPGNPNKAVRIGIIEQKSSSPQSIKKFEFTLSIENPKNDILAKSDIDPNSPFQRKAIISTTSNYFTPTRNLIVEEVKTAKILTLNGKS